MAEVPPAAAVMLITGFVACFTEFASNTATIIIFLPVIAELVRPLLLLTECYPENCMISGSKCRRIRVFVDAGMDLAISSRSAVGFVCSR